MKTLYQFIRFGKDEKTDTWFCFNRKNDAIIGTVEWYAKWKKWIYIPTHETIYDITCLEDIAHFLGQIRGDQ